MKEMLLKKIHREQASFTQLKVEHDMQNSSNSKIRRQNSRNINGMAYM